MRAAEDNFSYILVALIVFLIGVPAAIDLQLFGPAIIRAIGYACLLAIGVWSLRHTGRMFWVAMLLAISGEILNLLYFVNPTPEFYLGSEIAMLAFLLLATIESFNKIVRMNTINSNRIIGAISVYFLIGAVWAILYSLVEFAAPGSFKGLSEGSSAEINADWTYYSFVTLTTLGYGDILPVSLFSRSLAYMEAIVGQFYIAILVAGLVSAYISNKQTGQSG